MMGADALETVDAKRFRDHGNTAVVLVVVLVIVLGSQNSELEMAAKTRETRKL